MSRENYDSEFCGSLPLHHINQIQPYGCLLVLSKPDLKIVQASENITDVFAEDVKAIVGKSFKDFVTPDNFKSLETVLLGNLSERIPVSFIFLINDEELEYTAILHEKNGCILAELEKSGLKRNFIEVYQDMKYAMAEINVAESVTAVCEAAVVALKKLAGFDRVLTYQFDEDWNGTVIAEVREEDLEPYMGLKFPASDIPKQARALYHKNPYRLIPNREDKPERIFPLLNPVSNSFVDLSGCNLRSVAGVHLEYMANMGIKASMSVRIIRNGELWGIISCHHREAKYLSYELCSVFELLSDVISSKISSVLYQEQFNYKSRLWDIKREVVDAIYNAGDLLTGLVKSDESVLNLFSATGLAIVLNGKVHSQGNIPAPEDVKHLLFWLQHKMLQHVFADNNLFAAFEPAGGYVEQASGILAIPIGNKNEDFLLVFRPEVQATVSWGGNPADAISFEPDGKKYHPRSSFAIWQETVKQKSLPWTSEELELAESLRTFIFEYSTKYIYS